MPFQAGAIVRITLNHFVTYNFVEIWPGPSLNMIIGPNGTGKSTLVCAICLGLGYSTNVLGRAKDIGSFVKHGAKEAYIEIELQGKEDERNPIIGRKITRAGNLSAYYLHGKLTKFASVQKITRAYNVQIDNLCQFLPQDRVQEFANLPNTERLVATVRAAAPPDMLEYHKNLIQLGKEVVGDQTMLANDETQLKKLEARQAVLQQDVDRMRERQEVAAKIDKLKDIKPFLVYHIALQAANEAKTVSKQARAELRQLEQEIEPALERQERKKRYKEAIKIVLKRRAEAFGKKEVELTKVLDTTIPGLDEKMKETQQEIKAEVASEAKRKEELKKLNKQLEDTQTKLEAGPPEFDLTVFNNQLSETRAAHRECQNRVDELNNETQQFKERGTRIASDLDIAQTKLSELDSISGQREALLLRHHPETSKAWNWYLDNKDMFEKEIFPPPILSCYAKNPEQDADVIENLIGGVSTAFVCQTRADYLKFSLETLGSQDYVGLGLAQITIKDYSGSAVPRLEGHRRALSPEMLRRLGFDAIALDLVNGPPEVLNMLCHDCGLHNTPVSRREFNSQELKACEDTPAISHFIHGKNIVSIRRRYGLTGSQFDKLRKATIYSSQNLDENQKNEIERSISELSDELKEIREELSARKAEHEGIRKRIMEIQQEQKKITDKKNKKQHELSEFTHLKAQFKSLQEKLAMKTQGGSGHKEQIERLEKKLDKLAMKKAMVVQDVERLVGEVVDLRGELIKLRIRYAEAMSCEKLYEEKNADIIARRNDKQVEVEQLNREYVRLKAKTRQLLDGAKEAMTKITPEEGKQLLETMPHERTVEELDDEIDAEESRLSLIHEGNPDAIRQFEQRTERIIELKAKIDSINQSLEEKRAAIQEVRQLWEPKLIKLVARVSDAFSKSFRKIGCAGEVQVFKHEESFEKWAIEILVSFRNGEKLQVLNAQRQSGGERAVSTVFYLMALQSLAKSPFRVVDEINQGMDPRNERIVHHRMVNIACQQYTSQYFLITPKLLNGLLYHPRMKVHCIYSGEWVMDDFKFNITKFLKAGERQYGKGKQIKARRQLSEEEEEEEDDD
ncbi:P-loop containing nucleoside triphosphate hydrolase protein [Tricharina praecox]|uniref:P-loop containing nucleoside triphosphate hydrolase protein n=1 Tax=Tricharina praecox TaxID=43433 RepID=UPI00221F01C5|nr:P-loop containing nucleoside triphosphate hydrolase protein [Tricharina praecox]KAI5846095.1 P-loop containing nucleoside triphosphate hydrolase protein [Tricharina praecox]